MATIEVNISVSKSDAYSELEKLTGYIAAKKDDEGTDFEHTAINEHEHEMIDTYWRMACSDLNDAVSRYLSAYGTTTDVYSVTLKMPSNWNSLMDSTLNKMALDFAVNYMASLWLRVAREQGSAPVDEKKYAEDAASYLGSLRRNLFERVRPVKQS